MSRRRRSRSPRSNARDLGLSQVDWRLGSWFEPVAGERFDLIVANPPYVAAARPGAREAARPSPRSRLRAGPTGLEALERDHRRRRRRILHARGWLLLEHGSDPGAGGRRLLERHGFCDDSHRIPDFSGKPRVTLGTLHPPH